MDGFWAPAFVLNVIFCLAVCRAAISESYVHFSPFPPATTNTLVPRLNTETYTQYPFLFPGANRNPFSKRIRELRVLHSWRRVEFDFPTVDSEEEFTNEGLYVPGNAVILDSDYWSKGKREKLFVTLPRMKGGIPATLATVSPRRGSNLSPLLRPYPDWSWHGDKDCEGLISVFRIKTDQCGRLWVLDAGVTDTLGSFTRTCPPKLLVFDLETDRLLLKYVFPDEVLARETLLVTITVDIRDNVCADAYAYIADVTEFGLIVFDSRTLRSWRVSSNYFYPFPTHGSFSIGGESFDLMDGLIGLALSPVLLNGDRTLYFHSLASVREGKVSTSILRNSTNFESSHNLVNKKFYLSGEVRQSQSAAEDMSSQGVLFFGLLSPASIACWNAKLPFTPSNIVTLAASNSTLQFASGMKVVWKDGKEELLITTSRFHSYLLGSLTQTRDNFHILSASVSDLVRDTMCDTSLHAHKPRFLYT